jgi:hypothetical protein
MNLTAACEQSQQAFRRENPHLDRRKVITRAAMCDVDPPCVTELLFHSDIYATRPGGLSRCRSWHTDDDWPTREPHLHREALRPRARGFWSVLQLLPNRTVWVHGDSIQEQLCDAAMCSLMRDGVAPWPLLSAPDWLAPVARSTQYAFRSVLLPNGARLLCSAIGLFQQEQVSRVLKHVDVAVLNFGMHYHAGDALAAMLRAALSTLTVWQQAGEGRRLALWRETSAQHFPGGSYAPGAESTRAGERCRCHALEQGRSRQDEANLNLAARRLERRQAARSGVVIVPFFNITAVRYDMHRAQFCAYNDQRRLGRCCDCTHLCYTPLLWDALFGAMHARIRGRRKRRLSPMHF